MNAYIVVLTGIRGNKNTIAFHVRAKDETSAQDIAMSLQRRYGNVVVAGDIVSTTLLESLN
jgi:hypothetical protein